VTNLAAIPEILPTPVVDFFDLEIEEAEKAIGEIAGKKFHGSSFVNFVYKHRQTNPLEMFSLPLKAREALVGRVDLSPLPISQRLVSRDGTVKFLLKVETHKGQEEIECVYIPDEERVTLCVSSQVGCKMACRFCLTAQLGWKANLTAGQIVRQIWTVEQDPELRSITNIVFMGMGEPFDNIEQVRKACRILTHQKGLDKSARRITVSTVGLVDKIDSLAKEDPFKLAVSLNASNNKSRDEVMPVNKRWNIEELMRSCRDYVHRTNKRVTFEYILMAGVSDRLEDAQNLVRILQGVPCKINLIPYNESPYTAFKRPSADTIEFFHKYLLDRGFATFTRKNRGNDIFAACGMLRKETPS
jgi:23S rRNA (adenine2503-C2)-methyltransferase